MASKIDRKRKIQYDQRARRGSGGPYSREPAFPAEWNGRIVMDGNSVLLDGTLIGSVRKSGSGWRPTRPDGIDAIRRLTRIAAIRALWELYEFELKGK